jgi:hypothetical protein
MLVKIIEKLKERTIFTLLIIILGVILLIIGSIGYLPYGNQPIQLMQIQFRISLIIISILFIVFGSYIFLSDEKRVDGKTQYLFGGLKEKPRKGTVFQDFKIVRQGEYKNFNAVHYLWADTFIGSTINACIDTSESFLRIFFNNKPGSFPCNIAIRPENDQALVNDYATSSFLSFEARVPPNSTLSEVSIGIRIVNGRFEHWENSVQSGEYVQYIVNSNTFPEFHEFLVDLNSKNWHHFKADGNSNSKVVEETHDFKIIAFVIFEVGSSGPRSGQGKGVVDIRKIHLKGY